MTLIHSPEPGAPAAPPNYWDMLERLDAALARLLPLLEPVIPLRSDMRPSYGWTWNMQAPSPLAHPAIGLTLRWDGTQDGVELSLLAYGGQRLWQTFLRYTELPEGTQ